MVLEKLIGQFMFDKAASGMPTPAVSEAPAGGAKPRAAAAAAAGAAMAGGTK
jgi:hypothetical protein